MSDDFRGRGGSPWGSPPGGGNNNGSGRGPKPPNIDEIINEIQKLSCSDNEKNNITKKLELLKNKLEI